MPDQQRKSIQLLQEAIRRKRVHMGLPPEGKVNMKSVVEAMKEQPPMDELVAYIKKALKEDGGKPVQKGPPPTPRRRFDRIV